MSSAPVAGQVAQVLPALYALTTEEDFPARAMTVVRAVVGGDKCDYTEVDLVTGDFRVLVDPRPSQLDELAPARRAHMRTHPVLGHFLRDPRPVSRTITDFLTRREYRRTALYGDFFAHVGVEDQLTTLISPAAARRRVGISVDRDGGGGFSHRDRKLLDALQPHLVAARENAMRFSRALVGPPSEATSPLEGLTERQHEILGLISEGATNAQIGYVLGISVGTVRKHVEHILRSLGVHSRTGAAALYLRATRDDAATTWTASIAAMVIPSPSPPRSASAAP